jgi:hypothetical protein
VDNYEEVVGECRGERCNCSFWNIFKDFTKQQATWSKIEESCSSSGLGVSSGSWEFINV